MKQSYQDTWQDGARVAAGERDCEGRYRLIAATLPAAARFTVLDVGAYAGYFATRIVEDFDAAATAVGNVIKAKADIARGIERAQSIRGVQGVLIIIGDRLGLWGKMEIVRL